MSKVRVHEVATSCGATSKEILAFLQTQGVFAKSPSSALPAEAVKMTKDHFAAIPSTERLSTDSVRKPVRAVQPFRSALAQDAAALFGAKVATELERKQQSRAHSERLAHEWANRSFSRDDRKAWQAAGLKSADWDLAEAYRGNGLTPADLTTDIDGLPVLHWIQRGVSLRTLKTKLAQIRDPFSSGS